MSLIREYPWDRPNPKDILAFANFPSDVPSTMSGGDRFIIPKKPKLRRADLEVILTSECPVSPTLNPMVACDGIFVTKQLEAFFWRMNGDSELLLINTNSERKRFAICPNWAPYFETQRWTRLRPPEHTNVLGIWNTPRALRPYIDPFVPPRVPVHPIRCLEYSDKLYIGGFQ